VTVAHHDTDGAAAGIASRPTRQLPRVDIPP